MPLRDLLARAIHDFIPVTQLLTRALDPDLEATYDLVFRHAVPVEHQELEANILQTLIVRHVEQERLVEHRVQGSLLHVRLLFGDSLSVVQQVDLHIGIWIRVNVR